jgi:phosphoribosyl 1,2-cyclic phosphate phosphodiesterase
MRVTFLGTGTSCGLPVLGCDCLVCASDDPRNRRLRVSLLLEWNGANVVIDTGPDFREQMIRARVKRLDAVLYTHTHVDHLFGLDDIRIYCFRMGRRIPVFGERSALDRIHHVFDYAFAAKTEGGGVPQLEMHEITVREPFSLLGRRVMPLRVWHGSTPVVAYRIGNFAHATDCSDIPPATMDQLTGLDVLVLDALRPRPHSTHFSIAEAVAVAEKLQPKRTYFVHMTHDVDHETVNAQLPAGMELAYDGLVLDV